MKFWLYGLNCLSQHEKHVVCNYAYGLWCSVPLDVQLRDSDNDNVDDRICVILRL